MATINYLGCVFASPQQLEDLELYSSTVFALALPLLATEYDNRRSHFLMIVQDEGYDGVGDGCRGVTKLLRGSSEAGLYFFKNVALTSPVLFIFTARMTMLTYGNPLIGGRH